MTSAVAPLTAYVIIALVVMQRLGELALANRNTAALRARGAVEYGRAHYPLLVLLHAFWLLAIVWLLPHPPLIRWEFLALFVVLQAMRIWVIASLGPYWTTRIIALPGAPLVARGPYRFVRHPNYLVVAGEILVLPLAFGETLVAVVFTLLNAAVLALRITEEEKSLGPRRPL